MRIALVLGALACGRGNDQKPIDIGDFTEAAPLNDSLRKLVPAGTPVPTAQALMEQSGFKCDPEFHSTITVDIAAGKLGSGPPRLECWASRRIPPLWFNHQDWTVVYEYDGARVRSVNASSIIQP
jgi:hypothetical protein